MATFKLDFSQKMQQQLKLSPQMIQSIELLRLPIEELSDKIYQEAEKNPAIEIVSDANLSVRNVVPEKASRFLTASDNFQSFLENTADHEESLQEHLLFQLSLLPISDAERDLGERIIQNLDNHGFYSALPENLLYPNETSEQLENMLEVIRGFDPHGIAFANVQESLLFQAKMHSDYPLLVFTILEDYFSVLEKKRPNLITKILHEKGLECEIADVEKALQCIRNLDPYPARQFNPVDSSVQYAIPEIIVHKNEQNEHNNDTDSHALTVEFLKGSLPEITLSSVYTKIIEEKTASKENHRFVHESVQNAKTFMNALSYRTKSIYHAVQIIVNHQVDFFLKGPGHLVPLTQKDVADTIGMHEATVSRIANGKYLQCDWGIFELKYFFTTAVKSNEMLDGEIKNSKESIKHHIQQLLTENEKSGEKQLSDSKLSVLLEKKGITIARRTVAKYRNELNIESSFDRL